MLVIPGVGIEGNGRNPGFRGTRNQSRYGIPKYMSQISNLMMMIMT